MRTLQLIFRIAAHCVDLLHVVQRRRSGWRSFDAVLLALLISFFAWTARADYVGNFTPLDFLPRDINNHGDIVGQAQGQPPGLGSGILRNSGGHEALINFPGANFTEPQGINDDGVIAGTYSLTWPNNLQGFYRAMNASYASFQVPLPSNPGYTEGEGINNNNEILTYSVIDHTARAAVRSADGTMYVDAIPPGSSGVGPRAINDAGQTAGVIGLPGVSHWSAYVLDANHVDYSLLPFANDAYAWGLNNVGDVVGRFYSGLGPDGYTGFVAVRVGSGYSVYIPSIEGQWIENIFAINDYGVVVGVTLDAHGNEQGFLANFDPTLRATLPEPSTLLLLATAALALACRRFKIHSSVT